jgi:hypothetical protein
VKTWKEMKGINDSPMFVNFGSDVEMEDAL